MEKVRPVVVIVALAVAPAGDQIHVAVMPITHTPPRDPDVALELPPRLKQHLALDDDRSWVVLNEINEFDWPSPELMRVPHSGAWEYGQMPPAFFKQMKEKARSLELKSGLNILDRDEGRGRHLLKRPLIVDKAKDEGSP